MLDREKVIKELETEIQDFSPACTSDERLKETMEMALELLKEQEPRVLTFDELMGLPHGKEDNAPVVSEVKYPVGAWDKGTICKWRGAEFLQEMVQDHHWYNRDHYGKIWRVWTALPSIEQRKAVKWDAAD